MAENIRPKVYIAGPYTNPDPAINVRNAVLVADKLVQHDIVPFIPHLSHFWHIISPKSYEFWIHYDDQWLIVCNHLYRIEGKSSGADKEVEYATFLGIPVWNDMDIMLKHLSSK